MHRVLAVCLLVACCGPFGTAAVWLEGPPLKQPAPKAASPASEGFASPPESEIAAFVRPPASHEAWHVAGVEEGDEGGVTSQSATGAHAEAELGGWRGVRGAFKAVSGLPEMVVKLVEKGAQEELAEVQADIDAQGEQRAAAAGGTTGAAARRERRGRLEPKGGQHLDSSGGHGVQDREGSEGHAEPDHPPSPVAAYHFSKHEVAADRLRVELEPAEAAAAAEAAEAAAAAAEEAAAAAAAAAEEEEEAVAAAITAAKEVAAAEEVERARLQGVTEKAAAVAAVTAAAERAEAEAAAAREVAAAAEAAEAEEATAAVKAEVAEAAEAMRLRAEAMRRRAEDGEQEP
jgi:hypothetical protein